MLETLNKMINVEDDIDVFYKSNAMSVKLLPPHLISQVKILYLQTLNDLELNNMQHQHQQPTHHQST